MASIITAAVRWLRQLIMAAVRSRCGHYIFILWFLLSSILSCHLFSSPNLKPSQIGCLPYLNFLSANLECRSEMCCTRLTKNSGRKKIAKNLPAALHHTQLCRAVSSQLRHISTIGKKSLLNSNMWRRCGLMSNYFDHLLLYTVSK